VKHDYPHLAGRLFNTPLLVDPDKAATIAAVFNAYLQNEVAALPEFLPPERADIAAQVSARRAEGGYYLTNDGVAVVPVYGTLVQRAGGLEALSGLTGYNDINRRLTAAARDSGVRGIVLEFDSTGGEVEGVVETSTVISEIQKPVWAHANGLALSGAYWLAAAADRIYTTPTGLLGSIGVLIMHADRSRIVERSGVVYTPIYAGARKVDGSSLLPLTEEARGWMQSRVDELYEMFTDHVAGNRNMSVEDVRNTEAGIISAQESVNIGFSDGVMLLGETVATMASELYNGSLERKKVYRRAAVSAFHLGEHVMSTVPKDNAAAPVLAAITQADLDAARAAGRTEGATEAATAAKAAAEAAGVEARKRIKGITESAEGKKRPALANRLAFDSSMSVDDAIAFMAPLPEEAKAEAPTNALAARMEQEPNPKVGAGNGDGDGEETAEQMGTRLAGLAAKHKVRLVK
jgi:signal peptide peptidase SppA